MASDPYEPPTTKGSRWAITVWLTQNTGYTRETYDRFIQSLPPDWKLEGQEEKGKNSPDHHFQLMLWTGDTRKSRVMKIFPKCHIMKARNPFALQNYVHKSDTRVAELKTIETKSPQWHVIIDQFSAFAIEQGDHENLNDDEKLRIWDRFIGLSIEEGMRIDIVGVNPQYRSCIMKYWPNYINRYKRVSAQHPLETDRQTDKLENNSSHLSSITNDVSDNDEGTEQQWQEEDDEEQTEEEHSQSGSDYYTEGSSEGDSSSRSSD